MAKKNTNNKKSKLDTWVPICCMGGTLLGSIVSIVQENVVYLALGSCMGLMLGVIIGIDDIKFESSKKKSTKSTKKTKTKKK